jgi:signal transduction histidine kinase
LGRGIEIVAEAGDFSGLCRDVVEEVEAAHSDREFIVNIPPDLAAEFDAARMRQVLTNLLGNAVQYGDPTSPIVITVVRDATETTLAVMNRGRSISPDALQVIFDPLVQIPTTDQNGRPETSLGLGLYIVREIMSAHGGTVSVSSTDLDGTVFTLHLPHESSAEAK